MKAKSEVLDCFKQYIDICKSQLARVQHFKVTMIQSIVTSTSAISAAL